MGLEIERKFLVIDDSWKKNLPGLKYCQGYLSRDKKRTVRVRIAGKKGFLTIKGQGQNISRPEFEYEIPIQDASFMLANLCLQPLIEKIRYKLEYSGLIWEIDEFLAENKGLILAEIELEHEGQLFERPAWLGQEVSNDYRYFNSYLSANPYSRWL